MRRIGVRTMSATFPALANPSGTRHVRRLRRRPEPTGAAELDLDALIASGAMEAHRRRSLRQVLTDLLTWLRAPEP